MLVIYHLSTLPLYPFTSHLAVLTKYKNEFASNILNSYISDRFSDDFYD